jgi:thioredoxin reductase
MIFKNFDELKNFNFPVIIIGSGPAGISTALKLEEKKIKCLIIEAGEVDYSDLSQKSYS